MPKVTNTSKGELFAVEKILDELMAKEGSPCGAQFITPSPVQLVLLILRGFFLLLFFFNALKI